MTGYHFRPAVRSNSIPLIGVFGESGSGKTMSALLLARGLVGATGKICMIDSEGGRGELYADVIPGGYSVAQLTTPFNSDSYITAVTAAEKAGGDVIVIDGASAEWEGDGGVLDQAGVIEEKTGKPGLHCWNKPKAGHKKFMLKLLGAKVPVIICLRAKHKSRQVKNQRGKTEIIKDDFTTPIQSDDFIFEMTAHFETLKQKLDTGEDHHYIRLTKCSHPDLGQCFPKKGPITVETGVSVGAWAKEGDKPAPPAAATANTAKAEPKEPDGPEAAATEAAKLGVEAFREYWKQLTKDDRTPIMSLLPTLQTLAETVDAAKTDHAPAGDAYEGEIPFEGEGA